MITCTNHPYHEATGACVVCGKAYCSECLVEVNRKCSCKPHAAVLVMQEGQQQEPHQYLPKIQKPLKSQGVAIILCLFFGIFGIHRFYIGKIKTGIALLLSNSLILLHPAVIVLIGSIAIADLIAIITGKMDDAYDRPLV